MDLDLYIRCQTSLVHKLSVVPGFTIAKQASQKIVKTETILLRLFLAQLITPNISPSFHQTLFPLQKIKINFFLSFLFFFLFIFPGKLTMSAENTTYPNTTVYYNLMAGRNMITLCEPYSSFRGRIPFLNRVTSHFPIMVVLFPMLLVTTLTYTIQLLLRPFAEASFASQLLVSSYEP